MSPPAESRTFLQRSRCGRQGGRRGRGPLLGSAQFLEQDWRERFHVQVDGERFGWRVAGVGDDPPGRIEVVGYDGAAVVHRYTIDGVDLSCALCSNHLHSGQYVDDSGGNGAGRVFVFSGAH